MVPFDPAHQGEFRRTIMVVLEVEDGREVVASGVVSSREPKINMLHLQACAMPLPLPLSVATLLGAQ